MDKVLVAMSGGVDSSLALALLKSKGFDVIGATMLVNDHMEEAVKDAKKVAEKLEVEHIVFDYRKSFKKDIIAYFIDSYRNGITPNPCVKCNKEFKFGKLLQDAKSLGYDHMATGHYIEIYKDESIDKYMLKKTSVKSNDQSYFLYRLDQNQLSQILTPLSGYTKDEVRELAEKYELHIAKKNDSQEICFIENDDYKEYISKEFGIVQKEGDFVDNEGRVLGKHKGIMNYTIGQRRGLDIALGKPIYVVSIDKDKNQIILGEHSECSHKEIYVEDISMIYLLRITDGMEITCRTRSTMKAAKAVIYNFNKGLKVIFDEPIFSPAPGQSAVFYDGDIVLGGGIIKKI